MKNKELLTVESIKASNFIIESEDYDIYKSFQFTENGIVVIESCAGYDNKVLLTWEEVGKIKDTLIGTKGQGGTMSDEYEMSEAYEEWYDERCKAIIDDLGDERLGLKIKGALGAAFEAGRDSMREELMAKVDYKIMRRDLIPESVGTMSHYGYAFLEGAEHCLTWVKKQFGGPNE
jgi:hypothetical protein